VDEKTRTVTLRLSVKNGPGSAKGEAFALRPGMFVTVDLETSRKDGVLVLPLSAIQQVDGETVAFARVVPPSGQGAAFEKRRVVLGIRDGDIAEVIDGIQIGDEVVTGNGYLLKSELERSRIGGHSH
jgi:cobalt-zinc-cadmium efflux system membrane fusion protein